MTDEEFVNTMRPISAALHVAVERRDAERVAKILTPLSRDHLYALTIFQAGLIDTRTVMSADLLVKVPPIAHAVTASAARFNIDPKLIIEGNLRRDVIDARQVACYAAWLLGMTYVAIGNYFGQDHSTVINSRGRVGESPRLRTIATDIALELGWNRDETDQFLTETAS